jgi:hypothetical protein
VARNGGGDTADGGGTGACRHRLFGLTVASKLALPLPIVRGPESVTVCLGAVALDGDLLHRRPGPDAFACRRRGEAVILAWPGARFAVTGERVVVDARDRAAAVLLLLHPVWSVVLAARGREALHGCVVERDGQAVAFLGRSGTGKSTAGAGLLNRGWQLVTDDLIVVDDGGNVVPGPPFVRLLPDGRAARAAPVDAGGKARVYPTACATAPPLAALVVFTDGVRRAERRTGAAAVDALLTQVYNPILTHPGQSARRFALACALASRLPIVAVPPRSLSAEQATRLVEEMSR